MADLILEALVGIGELTLIMMVSAAILGLGFFVKQAIFSKPCDKK